LTSLNGALEVGVRLVFFLQAAFPGSYDVNQLVLADHLLTHSADSGGPKSLHPPIAIREGELGMKRTAVQAAIRRMADADLIRASANRSGIVYGAAERAYGFVALFSSPYAVELKAVASWVADQMENDSVTDSEEQMKRLIADWSKSLSGFYEHSKKGS
jgi:hypothetical protein